jgi:hypothetical protein
MRLGLRWWSPASAISSTELALEAVKPGFSGERDEHHMKKTRAENPRVTCGTCRMFDGTAWCRHWNFHTTAESPPCRFYKTKVVPG